MRNGEDDRGQQADGRPRRGIEGRPSTTPTIPSDAPSTTPTTVIRCKVGLRRRVVAAGVTNMLTDMIEPTVRRLMTTTTASSTTNTACTSSTCTPTCSA